MEYSREGLPNLPYSVQEIYGIRESGKYASLKQTYNEFYHIYGRENYTNLQEKTAAKILEVMEGIDLRDKEAE